MRELESIISAFEKAQAEDLQCTLATVVHVEGSSYRKAGARMLVDENGLMTGAISGGCLEGDALRKALHAMHQNKNKLISYDTSDEDDAVIGAQLGCNGIIQVLFEPINTEEENNPIALLKEVISSKERKVIVSLFNLNKHKEQKGTLLVFDSQLSTSNTLSDDILFEQIKNDASKVLEHEFPHFGEYHKDDEVQHAFLEHYTPPPTLVLVGAGNDAQVLSNMADILGWDIVVTDGRPTHANPERFISSCQVIVTKPEQFLDSVTIDNRAAFVLISHNYNYDLAVLKLLLNYPEIPYIGILGPKKKFNRMLDDLQLMGTEISNEQMSKIYAPIGLNIGAETPAEIALSVLSEIKAALTNSNGKPLREKQGTIHDKKHHQFKVTNL
ncbi:XdhC family protein [Fulvivirga sp. 2943]|uniref:XdhC family protein n=2 Tax=Fulvivirga sediminis TaxID=2803949 RepID=A0A937JZS5_9BACT|nr:XdhC family protein [Fulvivirga sediminis]